MTRPIALLVAALLLASLFTTSAAEFSVDPARSFIQVDVKATGHKFTGNLTKYSLEIAGDARSLTPASVDLEWNFVDLLTGDTKRDSAMLDWLQHGTYSTGTFTLSSFSKRDDGTMMAKGKLAFHGVSKTIEFPVTTEGSGGDLTVTGETSIDYQDFNLSKIKMALVLTVNPVLNVRFKLVGRIQ